jgi:hypothetical protein
MQPHQCTLVGCEDQATLDLQSPTGAWPPGSYQFALVIDGNAANCAIQVPAAPSGTTRVDGSCTSKITLTFLAEQQCGTPANDGAATGTTSSGSNSTQSETCSPVPGHFHQTLTLPGTPRDVALTLTRDDHSLVQQNVTLTYATSQPNGPGCDPTCHQASSALTIGDETPDSGPDASPVGDAAHE